MPQCGGGERITRVGGAVLFPSSWSDTNVINMEDWEDWRKVGGIVINGSSNGAVINLGSYRKARELEREQRLRQRNGIPLFISGQDIVRLEGLVRESHNHQWGLQGVRGSLETDTPPYHVIQKNMDSVRREMNSQVQTREPALVAHRVRRVKKKSFLDKVGDWASRFLK